MVRADTVIDQSSLNGGFVIQYFEPVGQSFTAIGSNLVSFDFYLETWDSNAANHSLTLSILQGDGLGGPVLASSVFTLPDTYFGLAGATFNLGVTVGAQYTAMISTDTWHWGLAGNTGDVYSGGQLYTGNSLGWGETVFRATFAESVPDSGSTIALFGGVLAVMAFFRRRLVA